MDEGADASLAVDVGPPGHPELMAKAKKLVATLLSDPFLSDLPGDVTAEEVSSIVSVEEGRAITVCVRRFDQQIIPVIVRQGCTVKELMSAFEKETERRCSRQNRTSHLSWRYVWRSYWLAFGQTRLEDKSKKLSSYGVGNKSEVNFVKKLRREDTGKRTAAAGPYR